MWDFELLLCMPYDEEYGGSAPMDLNMHTRRTLAK